MDLRMKSGKVATQSGHAYLGAFLKAPENVQRDYHVDGIGTKVCLECPDLQTLQEIYQKAIEAGIPAAFIDDSGPNTCFHGVTTSTAVGIGPVRRADVPFLKDFKLHR